MNKNDHTERYLELLAAARMHDLSASEQAELEHLLEEHEGDVSLDSYEVGELIVAFDEASGEQESMPHSLKSRLGRTGQVLVRNQPDARAGVPVGRLFAWAAIAAVVCVTSALAIYFINVASERRNDLESSREQVAVLQAKIEANQQTLADARAAVTSLEQEIESQSEERLALAERLAEATSELDAARLAIAQYEQPVDPEEMKANRRRLLEVPDTIRLAWQPFDLPDAPAEQQDVRGDVVWNNELEQGYLRFTGLAVNDPEVEQYQVWVIDERGMEQKVSGGVFNATAEGEVIVPIDPAIDVGRVALFAITIEEPGGTWVPDLKRRVVVAPADEG